MQREDPNSLIRGAQQGNCAQIEDALQAGMDINKTVDSTHHCTALHWAAMNSHIDAVKLLLLKGANVNSRDKTKWTVLHQAARNNADPQIIEELIKNEANLYLKDLNGDTPYDIAVKYNKNPVIHQTLKKTAENIQENFFKFAQEGECKEIEQTLNNGIDINIADQEQQLTALHWAVIKGHKEAIHFLLLHGANPNAKDKTGCTPLHWAVRTNAPPEIVSLLIDKGASLTIQNNDDHTAYDLSLKSDSKQEANLKYKDYCRQAKKVIADENGLVKIVPTTPPPHLPELKDVKTIKAIDYFMEQVEDTVNRRWLRPHLNLQAGDNRQHVWDPTTGELEKRDVPVERVKASVKPADYPYTKKEPFALLPANGKMQLIVRDPILQVGLLFDLNESYLKISKKTGQPKHVFDRDVNSNLIFWVGEHANGRKRIRASTVEAIREKNRQSVKLKGYVEEWNEFLACVSKKGFNGIFDSINTLDSRLHLLVTKIYLEKKYPFILEKYPYGMPLLIITKDKGVEIYSAQQQMEDFQKGVASNNPLIAELDKNYFVNYLAKNIDPLAFKNPLSRLTFTQDNAFYEQVLKATEILDTEANQVPSISLRNGP